MLLLADLREATRSANAVIPPGMETRAAVFIFRVNGVRSASVMIVRHGIDLACGSEAAWHTYINGEKMETRSTDVLEFYQSAKVVRLEASPATYTTYFLANLTRENGVAFDFQFIGDISRGQAAVDHMYMMLLAGLYSGRGVDVYTNGTKNSQGYAIVTNCVMSAH